MLKSSQRVYFSEPVAVWLFPGRPDLGVRLIRDVHDGLAALHRYGIERLKGKATPRPEWTRAKAALQSALAEPSARRVKRARDALAEAAACAGSLAATNRVEILVVTGTPFAP